MLKLRCDTRFQLALTACSFVFKVITLVWANHCKYFVNKTACCKRTLKTTVATQLSFFFVLWFDLKILLADYKFYVQLGRPMFFNLGSAEIRGSPHYSLGTVRILRLILFWVSWFRQRSIMFQRFRNEKKVEKHWRRMILRNAHLFHSKLYHPHQGFSTWGPIQVNELI